jgi:CubicO group peptidase (beta-lactamase class C family)
MKKLFISILAIFLYFTASLQSVAGISISPEKSHEIQSFLDEAVAISGVPGLSVAIVDGNETFYFSSGYSNREQEVPATKNTLFELASVSKAFTATGILLLEEQGHLSMADSIAEYLPWLYFQYEGQAVEMSDVTLNHFLHHTSGLTNVSHFQDIPKGDSEDMLQKTIETFAEAELDFQPGDQYSYGTINYDVLGLVIEMVSGQSYEQFMTEEVLQPVGLLNTYLYEEEALATEQLAQGYRTTFFRTTPYDAPIYAGNKPAGYVISNAEDMARWMNIQMGMIEDIPEPLENAIFESHQGDFSVNGEDGMYYGGGWLVNEEQTFIQHDGVNPNFSSQVFLFPKEEIGITLLANGAHTNNYNIVSEINQILNGDVRPSYERSAIHLSDIILSSLTILFILLAIIILLYGKYRRRGKSLKSKVPFYIALGMTIVSLILLFIYPSLLGYDWQTLLVWQSYSILCFLISLFLFSVSVTWVVWKNTKMNIINNQTDT